MSENTFPIRGMLTYENLSDVYVELSKDLPSEAVEHAPKSITRKNYDTIGYAYQFVVNRLNEVVFGHWRAIHQIIKEEVVQSNSGKPMYRIIVHMTIQLGNWITGENGREFEIIAEADCYGGHTSLEEESAFKGAYTNAFKKVAAFFGVGKKAFEGLIDEDYRDPGDTITQNGTPQNIQDKKQNNKKESNKLPAIRAKWKTLAGDIVEFDDWYKKQLEQGFSEEQMDAYLAKKIVDKQKTA